MRAGKQNTGTKMSRRARRNVKAGECEHPHVEPAQAWFTGQSYHTCVKCGAVIYGHEGIVGLPIRRGESIKLGMISSGEVTWDGALVQYYVVTGKNRRGTQFEAMKFKNFHHARAHNIWQGTLWAVDLEGKRIKIMEWIN